MPSNVRDERRRSQNEAAARDSLGERAENGVEVTDWVTGRARRKSVHIHLVRLGPKDSERTR